MSNIRVKMAHQKPCKQALPYCKVDWCGCRLPGANPFEGSIQNFALLLEGPVIIPPLVVGLLVRSLIVIAYRWRAVYECPAWGREGANLLLPAAPDHPQLSHVQLHQPLKAEHLVLHRAKGHPRLPRGSAPQGQRHLQRTDPHRPPPDSLGDALPLTLRSRWKTPKGLTFCATLTPSSSGPSSSGTTRASSACRQRDLR